MLLYIKQYHYFHLIFRHSLLEHHCNFQIIIGYVNSIPIKSDYQEKKLDFQWSSFLK